MVLSFGYLISFTSTSNKPHWDSSNITLAYRGPEWMGNGEVHPWVKMLFFL